MKLTDAEPAADAALTGALEPRIEDGKQIYEAAAFARFAPQTASDMARQIPGFTITRASEDRGPWRGDAECPHQRPANFREKQ